MKRLIAGLVLLSMSSVSHAQFDLNAGTLLGGAIGGFIGSHIGSGSGNLAATGAGVFIGSVLGNSTYHGPRGYHRGHHRGHRSEHYFGGGHKHVYHHHEQHTHTYYNPDKVIIHRTLFNSLEYSQTHAINSWYNPDTGNRGRVVIERTLSTSDGEVCREYQQRINIQGEVYDAYGMACRLADGSWQIQ